MLFRQSEKKYTKSSIHYQKKDYLATTFHDMADSAFFGMTSKRSL